jgi:hypothetical protein
MHNPYELSALARKISPLRHHMLKSANKEDNKKGIDAAI